MSQIYLEFERHLSTWHERYATRPQQEILCLYLLALEREENVVVAYGDRVLGPRLAKIPAPQSVRDVMRAALAQIRIDEEMHARYVRRMLLDIGEPAIRARTCFQQAAGAVGGWTVAVRQHLRWSEAPLSRAVATCILWMGEMTGRVPHAVRSHIAYCSFRDFCRYNVDTESTAWLCWQRLSALAAQVPGIAAEQVCEFRRIADDEERHRRIFAVLADSLSSLDEPHDGISAENLSTRIDDCGGRQRPNDCSAPAHLCDLRA